MHPVHTLLSISLKYTLILSSHLRLGLLSGLFASDFPTTILYAFIISPVQTASLSHLILLHFITIIIFGEALQVMKLLITESSPASRHFLPLRSKYSPHHLQDEKPFEEPLTDTADIHSLKYLTRNKEQCFPTTVRQLDH
jgi:hypothetical protein